MSEQPGEFDPCAPLPESWQEFLSEQRDKTQLMSPETPRGAGVLGRAYLEAALDDHLSRACKTGSESTTGFAEIVRSWSIKLKINTWCDYAKHSKRLREEMHCLNNLGAAFAHRPRANSFEHPEIAPLMKQLARATVDKHSPHLPPGARYRPSASGKTTISLALDECLAHIIEASNRATVK